MTTAPDLLAALNPTQAEAADHYTGPALVIAGAGSGKTRTLIYRIAHLIAHYGAAPGEILAVTFTNKAAAEMRERASHLVPGADQLWMSTFHSAGVRILRAYGEHIGLRRGFVIYDDDDQLDLLKEVMGSVPGIGPETSPRVVRGILDRAKSNLQTPADLDRAYEPYISGIPKDAAAEVYRRYEDRKKGQNAIDFGDLITETVRLFREVPGVLNAVQNRAKFIHVDEYQDTNKAQYELTRLLASRDRNLLVVGDPDQSIYKFRGADIQNILDFQKDYPDAKVYMLEHNYRSSARVLGIANKLIENNAERLDKTLRAVKEDGHAVVFHRATDHRAEGDFVAEWITRLHALEGRRFGEMAILYRTNAQSRVLEESLRRVQIPAKIVGGVGFYDRREIRDILAYARLAINPSDDVALRRIIGRPKRGIGDTALEKLLDWARIQGTTLLEACARAADDRILDRGANKPVEFAQLMAAMSDAAENYEPAPFLRYVIETSGYLDLLRTEGQEGQVRVENLEELVNAAEEWSQDHDGTIQDFLDDAALLSSVDDMRTKQENKGTPEDAVTLMTMHNAKGLEFPVVFIVGTEEGLLPSKGALVEAGGIEEERRLFYVAITRAMDRLFLTAAENRMQFGKTNAAEDSRFLEEIEGGFDTVDPYGQVIEYRAKTWKTYRPTVPVTPSAVKNTSPMTEGMAYRGGEKVRHPKFGEGQVLAVAGMGERQEVTVHFPSAGTKKLLVKFANLTAV
ncbi:DNA helicase-2/ATP-dependent DNA helicase PcrA [Deinococcus metalli]|uniref:DNA 3'-5' helicase n=1 Tax=Deinococcus metalli TaxID=1141878 RepID=A0A7W8KE34_9DEIO|nr:UvrD-helicase domain-containing protein [Deinococcus metalli]MBB5375331.1 DNA helicase-2/ATP-dependent DNA helicase PcrA [Deinococcus metalli]GHF30062.1 DNA helicase [Deinococcus metalli]